MTLPAFDTHAYVKRLKKAGFNEEQAEAQAELQTQVLSSLVTEKLVTKEDNLRLERALREDIAQLAQATKDNITDLRSELKSDIVGLRSELKGDIAGLRNELKGDITELREDITRLEHETKQEFIRIAGKFNTLNWMIGFVLAGLATIFTGIVTVLFKLFLHG